MLGERTHWICCQRNKCKSWNGKDANLFLHAALETKKRNRLINQSITVRRMHRSVFAYEDQSRFISSIRQYLVQERDLTWPSSIVALLLLLLIDLERQSSDQSVRKKRSNGEKIHCRTTHSVRQSKRERKTFVNNDQQERGRKSNVHPRVRPLTHEERRKTQQQNGRVSRVFFSLSRPLLRS